MKNPHTIIFTIWKNPVVVLPFWNILWFFRGSNPRNPKFEIRLSRDHLTLVELSLVQYKFIYFVSCAIQSNLIKYQFHNQNSDLLILQRFPDNLLSQCRVCLSFTLVNICVTKTYRNVVVTQPEQPPSMSQGHLTFFYTFDPLKALELRSDVHSALFISRNLSSENDVL